MNTIIQTPTNKLQNSIDFYTALKFKPIISSDHTLFTDGKAVIEINPDRFTRAGIKMYRPSWKKEISNLKKLTAATEIPGGYLLSDMSGTWIYLLESGSGIKYKKTESSFSLLGNFAGLSLETTDISRSAKLFGILGFEQKIGSAEQGWISFANEESFTISLMKPLCCPHLFFNPSMTYFNGKKNPVIIEKIRSLKIPIAEEITHFSKTGTVDNIIIRDPGGYGFFIFND